MARRLARVPAVVWAATVAVGALAAAWSVVLPLAEGPDEPSHLGLVLHLADGGGYPDHDDLRRSVAVVRLCTTHAAAVRVCPTPGEQVSAEAVRTRHADAAPRRADRPAWDDDGGESDTAARNQMPQHPPLYYLVLAGVLRGVRTLAGGPLSLDRELALLRLVTAGLVVPVPLLAWATARRAGLGERAARVAAVLPAGLPMLTATAAVVNNDNLLTVLGAAVTLGLVTLARGAGRRTAVLVGVVLATALLTKAFAVVFLPVVPLAHWLGSARPGVAEGRARWSRTARGVGWTALPVLVGAGPWYLRALLRTGTPTPSADADRYTSALAPPGFEADPLAFLDRFAGLFAERFWGSFGWYTVRFPGWLTVTLSGVAAVLVAAGLVAADRAAGADRRPSPGVVAVLLGPAVLLVALTASRAWTLHARSGQYPFIQGRYLFAALVGPVVVAARGWARLVGGRWSLPVLALGVAGLQGAALVAAVTRYWDGDGVAGRVDSLDAWSGWPDLGATALVAVGVFAVVALVGVAVRDARAGGTAPVPSGSP